MSADNGIYILQSLDGFRVIHAQAIENIYWHFTCCDNPNVIEKKIGDIYTVEICKNCNTERPIGVMKNEINPCFLKQYFGGCKIFKTKEESLLEAERIYNEILNDDYCPIIEYGIQFIRGWENKDFPK